MDVRMDEYQRRRYLQSLSKIYFVLSRLALWTKISGIILNVFTEVLHLQFFKKYLYITWVFENSSSPLLFRGKYCISIQYIIWSFNIIKIYFI